MFETGTELDSVLYQNETTIVFDETVSSLSINFRPSSLTPAPWRT